MDTPILLDPQRFQFMSNNDDLLHAFNNYLIIYV